MTAGMLTHAEALALAGAPPAFPLSGEESRDLATHLRGCDACARRAARLRTDLAALGRVDPAISPRLHDLIREVAVTQPRTGPSVLGILAILGLLALATLGVSAGVGALQGTRPPGLGPAASPEAAGPDQVAWNTGTVSLGAREFWIEANGLRFTAPGDVDLHSDPGDPAYWTLEASWVEHDREQRLFLYFAADERSWWIDGIQTWDGREAAAPGAKGSVAFGEGPWAVTPRWDAFTGNLDVVGTSETGPVRVHLGGARIAVNPRDGANPPLPGAPAEPDLAGLACSGILQLPPPAADLRLRALGWATDWRWQSATGAMTGQSEIRDEPPSEGYVSGVAPGPPGVLVVFVEDPANPSMPAVTPPPGCATAVP